MINNATMNTAPAVSKKYRLNKISSSIAFPRKVGQNFYSAHAGFAMWQKAQLAIVTAITTAQKYGDKFQAESSTSSGPMHRMYLNSLKGDKIELVFHGGLALQVDIYFEDNHFIAFNEHFGIYGFGDKLDEALSNFNDSFIDFYDDIVNSPESELGESTLEFKRILLSFAAFRQYE